MCVPGCQDTVMRRLSRRSFFKQAAVAGAVSAAGCAASAMPGSGARSAKPAARSFSEVRDLTHTVSEDFPAFGGSPGISLRPVTSIAKNGYYMNEWTVIEHFGTHIDAPIHFSEHGTPVDKIPASQLVVPLAVIDIRAKADGDSDAQLTPGDIAAYEARHGPIPQGACVAMNSGWDAHVRTPKFRNADESGTLHFPGFHVEAAQMLAEERAAAGIAVDTLSLDYGRSKDFATHTYWLPKDRWGIECAANLSELPASGATIVVGAPAVSGASGGLSRIFALI